MAYRDLSSDFGWPDWVKRISQLDASFAHVEDKHGQTSDTHGTKLFPISSQTFPVVIILMEKKAKFRKKEKNR